MDRIKLSDRILPTYSKGEEIFNMVSHIVGGALGVVALVLCVIFSALHHNVYGVVASSIYGTSLILLYTMSSIYHGLNPDTKTRTKKIFQIFDHCSIFILIAGSYTPFSLCTLREYNSATGWTIFGVVWGLAILGIVFNYNLCLLISILFSIISLIILFNIKIDSIETRPTLDRVKESLFNIIQNKLEDAIVLDLFAGSGAIGIECISRGAEKADS